VTASRDRPVTPVWVGPRRLRDAPAPASWFPSPRVTLPALLTCIHTVQAVSKLILRLINRWPERKTTRAYWERRLFQNSYTRNGRTRRVRRWSVKIQHAGVRRTFSLGPTGRIGAARAALALYRALLKGEEIERKKPRLVGKTVATSSRVRVVTRPYSPLGAAELSAHAEGNARSHYFPLGTSDPEEANRRARSLQRSIRSHGITAILAQHPREETVAIHWSANPLGWTYSTVHTHPDEPGSSGPEIIQGRAVGKLPVFILEPDRGLGRALRDGVNQQPNCRAVALYSRAADALVELARDPRGLLLLNQTLDGLSGTDFLARLRHLSPRLPALVYSVYDDSDQLFKSTPGGAVGYLLRRTPPNRILEPLEDWRSSEGPRGQELTSRALSYFQRLIGSPVASGNSLEMARLTARELEILGLLSKGFLDKEIARTLQISAWTVHGHAKNIFGKLGVHTRTEAVVKYLQK
jgi:DNA-binding NarL/FixJ family response regulator